MNALNLSNGFEYALVELTRLFNIIYPALYIVTIWSLLLLALDVIFRRRWKK